MTEPTIDFGDLRRAYHENAEQRREVRRDRKRFAEMKADKECLYRKRLWSAFAEKRSDKESVAAAELYARAEAAELGRERDMADACVKDCDHRIDQLEAERASLRQLGEWSMRLEGLPQPDWRTAA